ncbi:hypothetical protein [Cellvibrio sp. OA-2007]|uniref:hypothetical protein n=1 Tax=Cellvibrio sp. OA-2007 TaxID=529823 RepID=UPI000782F8ED|nr:hypothetical protein [Cellvibrio sp. OA-2007]
MFNLNWKVKAVGIVVLVIVGFAYSIFDKNQSAAYAQAPAVGDVYTVKLKSFFPSDNQSSYPYGVMKVDAVNGSKVTLNIASARFGNAKSVRKSLRTDGQNANFYSNETLELDKEQLVSLVESSGITHIER